jgi:hypothetical protein
MTQGDLAFAVAAAAAASLLLNAGLAKLASPGQLRRAVAELLPVAGRRLGGALVRGLGAAEILVGTGLLIAPARLPAAVAATGLGACFIALGALGQVRGSSVPCGCFAAAGQHPLGWTNIGLGAALALTWPVMAQAGPVPAGGYLAVAAPLASIGTVLLCLWLNRRLILVLRRPNRARPARSGVT